MMIRSVGLGFGVPSGAVRESVKSWILTHNVHTHEYGRVILSPRALANHTLWSGTPTL